jgi:hypothetical protein
MRSLGWLLVSACVVVAASCGLAGATGPGAGGAGGGSSSAASSTGGANGGGHSSTSQSTTVTTGSNGGAGGTTGSGGGSGGAPATSSSTAAGTGGGPGDCDPASPGVCCPDAACGQKCCYTRGAGLACGPGMCTGPNTFLFQCDDSRDCSNGEICCSTFDGTDYTTPFKCVPPGMCMPHPAGAGTHEICDWGGDRVCAAGGSCMQGTLLGGKHGYCAQ